MHPSKINIVVSSKYIAGQSQITMDTKFRRISNAPEPRNNLIAVDVGIGPMLSTMIAETTKYNKKTYK